MKYYIKCSLISSKACKARYLCTSPNLACYRPMWESRKCLHYAVFHQPRHRCAPPSDEPCRSPGVSVGVAFTRYARQVERPRMPLLILRNLVCIINSISLIVKTPSVSKCSGIMLRGYFMRNVLALIVACDHLAYARHNALFYGKIACGERNYLSRPGHLVYTSIYSLLIASAFMRQSRW